MRTEIQENDLELVSGGKVYLNGNKMKISFTMLEQTFKVKCSYQEAKTLLLNLFASNDHLSDLDFDNLVKNEFQSRGWI